MNQDQLDFFNKVKTDKIPTRIFAFFNVCPDPGIKISQEAIQYGLRGAFIGGDSLDNVVKGIMAIVSGEYWFPRNLMMKSLLEEKENLNISDDSETFEAKLEEALVAELTSREREVLSAISKGSSNKEIASEFNISLSTVKTHVQNIFPKIGVSGRLQAALWANKFL